MTIGAWCCAAYVGVATVPLTRTDLREHRLPNAWTLSGWLVAVIALVAQWAVTGEFAHGAVLAALAALVLFGAFALFADMGMGDVKLAVPLAAGLGFVGMHSVTLALFVAFFAAGAVAVVLLARGRARDTPIAFGPFLLIGYWSAFSAAMVSSAAV